MTFRAVQAVAAALAVAAFVATALAVKEELLEEARKYVAESRPFVEKANDVDLPMEQRRAPRKEAFTRLKHARELFDQYLDANPSMEEKLDGEYTKIVGDIFWLKKESGLGELEKEPPSDAPPPTPSPEDKSAGSGGAVAPPAGPPKLGPEAPAGKGESPSDFAFRAKKKFEAIAAFEKAHAGDLPTLKGHYEQFLADFSDPSLPEYALAVEKLGKINDRLKTVLKEDGKRDPDTIKTDDSKAEKSIFGRLTSDFNSKDAETRRRAAHLMAAARVRSAAHFLARGLFDPDEQVADSCRDGLIGVGGRFVGEKLVEFYRDAAKEKQLVALDVLAAIVKKGPVDAAAESPSIGHFLLSNESDVAVRSLDLLTSMGRIGGPGLMFGLDSKIVLKKTETMKSIATVKYYRAATTIADRYLGTKVPPALRQAAMDALEALGKPAVPYMISVLSSDSGAYTAFVLRKITGDPTIIVGDEKKVRAWCNEHKDECADK